MTKIYLIHVFRFSKSFHFFFVTISHLADCKNHQQQQKIHFDLVYIFVRSFQILFLKKLFSLSNFPKNTVVLSLRFLVILLLLFFYYYFKKKNIVKNNLFFSSIFPIKFLNHLVFSSILFIFLLVVLPL